jgi:hypothetical protein
VWRSPSVIDVSGNDFNLTNAAGGAPFNSCGNSAREGFINKTLETGNAINDQEQPPT